MTRDDIDTLWQQALIESVKDGEQFTRYHFASLVAAAEREACAKKMDELCGKLSRKDNLPKLPTGRYICHVCNRQEMVRAKFDEESG